MKRKSKLLVMIAFLTVLLSVSMLIFISCKKQKKEAVFDNFSKEWNTTLKEKTANDKVTLQLNGYLANSTNGSKGDDMINTTLDIETKRVIKNSDNTIVDLNIKVKDIKIHSQLAREFSGNNEEKILRVWNNEFYLSKSSAFEFSNLKGFYLKARINTKKDGAKIVSDISQIRIPQDKQELYNQILIREKDEDLKSLKSFISEQLGKTLKLDGNEYVAEDTYSKPDPAGSSDNSISDNVMAFFNSPIMYDTEVLDNNHKLEGNTYTITNSKAAMSSIQSLLKELISSRGLVAIIISSIFPEGTGLSNDGQKISQEELSEDIDKLFDSTQWADIQITLKKSGKKISELQTFQNGSKYIVEKKDFLSKLLKKIDENQTLTPEEKRRAKDQVNGYFKNSNLVIQINLDSVSKYEY